VGVNNDYHSKNGLIGFLNCPSRTHTQSLDQYTNLVEYKRLLKQAASTMDRVELQLKKTMAGNSDDDCEGWLLGIGFSAVDISLGTILHRLAKLGLRHYFWSHGKRPFIHKFIRQTQMRKSFVKAMTTLPLAEIIGPKPQLQPGYSLESRTSLDELDIYVQMETLSSLSEENKKKPPPPLKVTSKTQESMEVFNVLHEANVEDDIITEREASQVFQALQTRIEDPDIEEDKPVKKEKTWKHMWKDSSEEAPAEQEKDKERTWKDLWISDEDEKN
jgi:hypothetical protein